MNAMDMVVQALEFGAELVGSARRQVRDFSDVARDQASDFADVARKRSGKFSSAARDRAADYSDQAADYTRAARKRARDFGETASDRARDFGEAARDRVRDFGESARETVRDFADEAPKKARRLRKKLAEQIEPEPSTGARILPFVAGLSVGFGAAMLLAPRSGRETRARLTRRAQNIEFPKTADMR